MIAFLGSCFTLWEGNFGFRRMKVIKVCLSILAVSLGESRDCPLDWRRYENNCYRVFDDRTTFNSALRRCAAYQGYLLSVRNEWENSFISGIISRYQDNQFWIGIYFNSTSGYWLDDGTEVTWSKWVGPKTACPLMTGITKWTTEKCSYYHQYICQLELAKENGNMGLYKDTTTVTKSTSTKGLDQTSVVTSTRKKSIPDNVDVIRSTHNDDTKDPEREPISDTTPEVVFINRKKNPGRTHTDNRPSAIGIGSIGIAVLICVFLGIFLLDASKLWRDFGMFRHNVSEILRRFRRSKMRKNNQFKIEDIQDHTT